MVSTILFICKLKFGFMHASWNELFKKAPHSPAKDIEFWSDQSVINKFLPESLSEKSRGAYEMGSDVSAVKVMQGFTFSSVYSWWSSSWPGMQLYCSGKQEKYSEVLDFVSVS